MAGRRIRALAAFAAATACTSPGASPSEAPSPPGSPPAVASYAHADPAFSISYPGTWAVSENVQNAIVGLYSPAEDPTDPFPENIQVVREPVSDATTLDAYTKLSIRNAGTLIQDFSLTADAIAPLSGQPAIWIEYSGRISGRSLRFLTAWTIKDGSAWVVTFTATPSTFEPYVRQARQIMSSFELG